MAVRHQIRRLEAYTALVLLNTLADCRYRSLWPLSESSPLSFYHLFIFCDFTMNYTRPFVIPSARRACCLEPTNILSSTLVVSFSLSFRFRIRGPGVCVALTISLAFRVVATHSFPPFFICSCSWSPLSLSPAYAFPS